MKEKKKLSLAAQIFIALVLAVIAGLLMQKYANFAETYIKPFGTIFLNLLKFIVVPIVLFSIMCGIISMKDIKKVGSIGAKTVVYYMCTTAFAITFGLIGANMFKGAFPKIATTDLSYKADQTISLMDTIVNIFPSNFVSPMVEANMLQVIVTALILGFGIILLGEGERNTRLVTACNDLNDVFMKCMEMILKLSPIGVFCLLSPVIASNGPAIIGSLAMVLTSVGLPVDGIALVAGVDRIFDMGRTVVNITGDASCVVLLFRIWNGRKMQRGKLQTDCRLVEPVGTACCVVFSVPVARYKNENNRCFPVCVLGAPIIL